MQDFFQMAFGIGGQGDLTWWQMSVRAVGVFIAALIILKIGNQRIFGKHTTFDIVLGVIYGSILSRAITGNSPFWPTLAAALVLVLLHNLLARLAYLTNFGVGRFIKGWPLILIKDGDLQHKALKRNGITENDLKEVLRKSGSDGDLNNIRTAYLERSGDISIIQKEKE